MMYIYMCNNFNAKIKTISNTVIIEIYYMLIFADIMQKITLV